MKTNELEGLQGLCEKVAAHLSGHSVRVRFQKPIYKGVTGTAMKSAGEGVIDIDPAAPLAEQYKALVHECAHLVNDWEGLGDYTFLDPGTIPTTKATRTEMSADPIEKPARDLAFEWLKFADFHRFKYCKSYPGEVVPRLAALLEWTPESQKIINHQ